MKKIIVGLLSICLLMSQAMAGHTDGLKQAFDELNYSLNVEWDQEDPQFLTDKKEEFYSKLAKLKVAGLTTEEMLSFTLSNIKDQQAAKEIDSLFSLLVSNQLKEDEAYSQILNIMDKSYNRGASWSGRTAVLIIVPTILVIAVVYMATCNAKKDSRKDKGGLCGNTDHL
jgi:hypothetical protein